MEKFKRIIRENLLLIIVIMVLLILVIFLKEYFKTFIRIIDINIELLIKEIRSDKFIPFFKVVSFLGSAKFLIPLMIVMIIAMKFKKEGFYIIFGISISCLLNEILKRIVRRNRPVYKVVNESGFSFPSGHAMNNMVFYGLIINYLCKNIKRKSLKILSVSFMMLLVLLIGFSRIYLGVHYFSDVVCGYIIGILYLILYIRVINVIDDKQDK